MRYHVRSTVPNMKFCVPALGSIFNCCTAPGENVGVGPSIILISPPLGTLTSVSVMKNYDS